MKRSPLLRAASLGVAILLIATPAAAAGSDYTFEPVHTDVKNGEGSELAVRLVKKSNREPVDGAIIFRSRLDMSPDDMAGMTANLEPLPGTNSGVYRFKADLTMAGRWALKLMAKVPGEAETVQGSVIFNAKD